MSLKLVSEFTCDKCSTSLNTEIDYGYEENQHLCQSCYNKAVDDYEGELLEVGSYRQAYEVLLYRFNELETKFNLKNQKLRAANQKLKELGTLA